MHLPWDAFLDLICVVYAQDSRVISVACGAEHTLAALDTGEVRTCV